MEMNRTQTIETWLQKNRKEIQEYGQDIELWSEDFVSEYRKRKTAIYMQLYQGTPTVIDAGRERARDILEERTLDQSSLIVKLSFSGCSFDIYKLEMKCGLKFNMDIEYKAEEIDLLVSGHSKHHQKKHLLDPMGTGNYYIDMTGNCTTPSSCLGSAVRYDMFELYNQKWLEIANIPTCLMIATTLICAFDCGLHIPRYVTTYQINKIKDEHSQFHLDREKLSRPAYQIWYVDTPDSGKVEAEKTPNRRKRKRKLIGV